MAANWDRYVEVVQLKHISSESLIQALKSQFARHGISYIVYSDPGTQLDSFSIRKFAKEWNFDHITSSTKNSQSNGMVERHIVTIKKIFKKLDADGDKDLALALVEYRNTPIGEELKFLNELMFNRKVRSLLPLSINSERKKEMREIRNKLLERQLRQKVYYDKNAHNLKPLKVNDI